MLYCKKFREITFHKNNSAKIAIFCWSHSIFLPENLINFFPKMLILPQSGNGETPQIHIWNCIFFFNFRAIIVDCFFLDNYLQRQPPIPIPWHCLTVGNLTHVKLRTSHFSSIIFLLPIFISFVAESPLIILSLQTK